MATQKRVLLAAIATTIAALAMAGGALGAPGDLTPQGCISDIGDSAGCGATAQGLFGAGDVAVSRDGTSLYAVSSIDNAIVRFDRAANGALTPQGCISDVGDPAGCGATAHGLEDAQGLTVSPDGASVYVTSTGDNAIVRFDRSSSGALSNPSCIEDVQINRTCDDVGPAGEAQGLFLAQGVVVSPDGASVYVASGADSAIVRFDRAASGALSNPSCIEDPPSDAGCASTTPGLGGAFGVAASPDGASVYVTSFASDDAIVRFDRAASGALTPQGCIADVGDFAGCGVTTQGLDKAAGVAVSPDGAHVYVTSDGDDAIVDFDRAASGALTPAGCIADPPNAAGCGTTAQGLGRANGIAVTADGSGIFTSAFGDHAVARFDPELAAVPSPPSGAAPDTAPPDTQITKGPKQKTKDKRATFQFTSTEPGSTFECKLDNRAFEPCASPEKLRVKKGKHEFEVRARDPSGNVDPTPATDSWKVKKAKKKTKK